MTGDKESGYFYFETCKNRYLIFNCLILISTLFIFSSKLVDINKKLKKASPSSLWNHFKNKAEGKVDLGDVSKVRNPIQKTNLSLIVTAIKANLKEKVFVQKIKKT